MNELELLSKLSELRQQYKDLYESFPEKRMANGDTARDIPANKIEELRKRMEEINEVAAQYDEALSFRKTLEGAEKRINDDRRERTPEVPDLRGKREMRTVAQQVLQTPNFRDALRGGIGVSMPEFRALMTTTAGYAPEVVREGVNIPAISRPLGLLDFVSIVPTTQNATLFMRQTTRTMPANAKGQGVAADEATIVWTEVNSPISTITVYIPASKEQLDDEPGLEAMIGMDLMLGVRQGLESQITVGDGVGSNLTGVVTAATQTQAVGAGGRFDAILDAANQVRTANGSGGRGGRFANPNLVLLTPTDLNSIRKLRTTDGIYILGNPGDVPASRIWGMNVGESLSLTTGTGVVMDTTFMRVRSREDATIYTTDSDGVDFQKRIIKLRADLRAGFEIHSLEAICKVTGL